VTEPGSLTVTGPAGEVGAEVRIGAAEAGAPGFGVDEQGYPDVEVGGASVQAASEYSGVERQLSAK